MNPNDPYQGLPGQNQTPQQPQGTPPQLDGAFGSTPSPMAGTGGGVNGGHNPYEFIMTSNQQPQKSSLYFGNGNKPIKLLAIVGGITLLIIIAGLIATAFIPRGASADELQAIVQRQAEMSRVAGDAQREAESETAKALAYNISFSISSGESSLRSVMSERGISVDEKAIEQSEDSTTDETLEDAKATSSYDSTFTQLMDDQLTGYLAALKTTYQGTTNPEIKSVLDELYGDGALLLQQAGGDIAS